VVVQVRLEVPVAVSAQKPDAEEYARLAALRRYRILDTEPEQRFDDLTMLASQVCETPIALITLVDADRQWFKSKVGTHVSETARSVSFCAHAMRQRSLFVIPDARADPRFRDNPMVTGEPRILFYAGASLISREGQPLGSICVIDHVPRTLTGEQAEALDALRRQVESQLELRRNLAELEAALAARDRAEHAQAQLVDNLRTSLDHVEKLTELIPLCSTCQLNMTIPADPAAISTVSEGLERLLQEKGWSESDVIRVDLAVREALANAIRHGCGGDNSKKVQCCVTFESPQEVVIVVRDPGPGFDANAVPDPMTSENMFKSSGRGVYLINQLMDEVGFRDGGREVEMRKRAEREVEAQAETEV
jgi:anti-sigma regulatory factor (Ser/Thr protein kinase)